MAKKRKNGAGTQKSPSKGWLAWLIKAGFLVLIWAALATACVVAFYAFDLPDIHQITQWQRRPSITMEADDGAVFARTGDLYGDHLSLHDVPKCLPEAIISIEDRRLYHHFGLDPLGMIRAASRDVLARHLVEGGSTITQQLAKNLFLTPERTLRRKVQEAILAIELEHTYSKDEILTAYINRVYLGNGTYGVDAAALAYFGKSARELDLRECAVIAGLLRAPSRFAPSHDAAQSMERAHTVLDTMVESGYIDKKQEAAALSDTPLPEHKPGAGGDGRYFADWISDQIGPLIENAPQDLIVKTTLDIRLQRAAERDVNGILDKQEKSDVSQAALVTLAPDGAIKALVGGRDYHASQFDRATQALRQPGSAFKPIVYLAAIEDGLRPDDLVLDAPLSVNGYSPENFDNKYRGEITAREALAESVNTAAVRVLQRAGIEKVIQTGKALGITSPLERDTALALGASVVTPLEMTTVYASLAAGGRAIAPYGIKEVSTRTGQVLYRRTEVDAPLTVSSDAVAILTGMMQEVVRSGTGKRAALGDRPVAGKTGTSSDYRDAWFLGFTREYTTGVWLGNDNDMPMKKITGGSLPAQLWHDYMTEAEEGLPIKDFQSETLWGTTAAATENLSHAFGDFINGILGNNTGKPTPQ